MDFQTAFMVSMALVFASLPYVRRHYGSQASLSGLFAIGVLSTLYLAIFLPDASSAHAQAVGPWGNSLAQLLDATHGKWPIVVLCGALTAAAFALLVRATACERCAD